MKRLLVVVITVFLVFILSYLVLWFQINSVTKNLNFCDADSSKQCLAFQEQEFKKVVTIAALLVISQIIIIGIVLKKLKLRLLNIIGIILLSYIIISAVFVFFMLGIGMSGDSGPPDPIYVSILIIPYFLAPPVIFGAFYLALSKIKL